MPKINFQLKKEVLTPTEVEQGIHRKIHTSPTMYSHFNIEDKVDYANENFVRATHYIEGRKPQSLIDSEKLEDSIISFEGQPDARLGLMKTLIKDYGPPEFAEDVPIIKEVYRDSDIIAKLQIILSIPEDGEILEMGRGYFDFTFYDGSNNMYRFNTHTGTISQHTDKGLVKLITIWKNPIS